MPDSNLSALAPIVLFVYNRPWHTQQTLEALSSNALAAKSTIYIYADAAKADATEDDLANITAVRELIRSKQWCGKVVIVEREQNYGLARNIVEGVTEIVHKHGKIIVMEDDIVTSPGYLKYMNDALELYRDEEKVMHVSGYWMPVKNTAELDDTFFFNATLCWGWATWADAWSEFNDNAADLLQKVAPQRREFDIGDSAEFFSQLEDNTTHKIKTWAVKWYASVFLKGGFCLHPNTSFVRNIGNDDSGVHSMATDVFHWDRLATNMELKRLPLRESALARKKMQAFYRELHGNKSVMSREGIKKKMKALLPVWLKTRIKALTTRTLFIDQSVRRAKSSRVKSVFGGTVTIGKNTELMDGVLIYTYGGDIEIGQNCSINPYTIIYGHGGTKIGDNVLIAGHCMIIPNNHVFKDKNVPINAQGHLSKGIHIADDVWIGHSCSILDGITIGAGAVIAAGSVVVSNVEPYSIYAGVPAKKIKSR